MVYRSWNLVQISDNDHEFENIQTSFPSVLLQLGVFNNLFDYYCLKINYFQGGKNKLFYFQGGKINYFIFC